MNCAFVYVTIQLNYNMLRTIPRDNGLTISSVPNLLQYSLSKILRKDATIKIKNTQHTKINISLRNTWWAHWSLNILSVHLCGVLWNTPTIFGSDNQPYNILTCTLFQEGLSMCAPLEGGGKAQENGL